MDDARLRRSRLRPVLKFRHHLGREQLDLALHVVARQITLVAEPQEVLGIKCLLGFGEPAAQCTRLCRYTRNR
jgi:hypothetical protein